MPGAMALAVLAGGCRTAGFSGVEFSRNATPVEASAFAEPGSAGPTNARTPRPASPSSEERPRTLSVSRPIDSVAVSDERLRAAPRLTPREASGGIDPSQVRVATEQETEPGQDTGERAEPAPAMLPMTTIDAKVGDINGKAIYASAVFRSPDAALRATARQVRLGEMTRDEWIRRTSRTLAVALEELRNEELLRAEAISKLPSEQRRFGVRGFLDLVREGEARRAGGVGSAARRRAEDPDRTYEEYLERTGTMMVIQELIFEPLRRRASVPWRRIEEAYERQFERFNPEASVVFRMIRVSQRRPDSIERIQNALDEGLPFVEVAAMPDNGFVSDEPGRIAFTMRGTLEEASFFSSEAVNEAVRELAKGEWAGPIEAQPFIFWIMLEQIDRRSVPLIDAQRELRSQLENTMLLESQEELIERLVRRASFTEMEVMHRRLMEIAIQRYLPPEPGRNGAR